MPWVLAARCIPSLGTLFSGSGDIFNELSKILESEANRDRLSLRRTRGTMWSH